MKLVVGAANPDGYKFAATVKCYLATAAGTSPVEMTADAVAANTYYAAK